MIPRRFLIFMLDLLYSTAFETNKLTVIAKQTASVGLRYKFLFIYFLNVA